MNVQEKLTHLVFPKVGLRNIKTALAAALCALVYYFLDRSPAFACIGAIFGMGGSYEQSRLYVRMGIRDDVVDEFPLKHTKPAA